MANKFSPNTRSQTLYSSTAAANFSSADFILQGEVGVKFDFHVTAITGTSVTFTIFYRDDSSGTYITTGLATAAISAAGNASLTIDPRIATAANVALNAVPNRTLRITTTGTWTVLTAGIVATCSY